MAKNHAPSLLFSVIVHVLAGLIFYLTYQAVSSLIKPKKQETSICVSLSTYKVQKKKEPIKEKVVKKKIPKKKIIHKKIVHKKVIHKKIVKKLEPQVIKKSIPIISKPIISTIEKEEIEPSKQIAHTQETNATVKPQKVSLQKEYVDNHLQKIQELLRDNLYYPRRARKRGIVGTVIVHFEIDKRGEVTQVKALSSQSDILSRAAVKTIKNLSGVFPKPTEKLFLKIPIVYKLNN